MSNAKHALGVLGAGALAFGAVFAAYGAFPAAHDQAPGAEETPSEELVPGPTEPDMIVPTEQQIVGRWLDAEGSFNREAFVEFAEDGTWTASDGCNGAESTWTLGLDGAFDPGGPIAMTMMACDNSPIPMRVSDAVAVEASEDTLVLIDASGSRYELTRAE